MARNRLRGELGKGVEALRSSSLHFTSIVANNKTLDGTIGPFEVDIDVMSVVVVSGVLVTADAANTFDVFNGTVAANKPIITQIKPDGTSLMTIQVPVTCTLTVANQRVAAGTPITVRLVLPGNTVTPADFGVRIGYDIPIYDIKGAKITTYGTYDDGM